MSKFEPYDLTVKFGDNAKDFCYFSNDKRISLGGTGSNKSTYGIDSRAPGIFRLYSGNRGESVTPLSISFTPEDEPYADCAIFIARDMKTAAAFGHIGPGTYKYIQDVKTVQKGLFWDSYRQRSGFVKIDGPDEEKYDRDARLRRAIIIEREYIADPVLRETLGLD